MNKDNGNEANASGRGEDESLSDSSAADQGTSQPNVTEEGGNNTSSNGNANIESDTSESQGQVDDTAAASNELSTMTSSTASKDSKYGNSSARSSTISDNSLKPNKQGVTTGVCAAPSSVMKTVGKAGKASIKTVGQAGKASVKGVEMAGRRSIKTVEMAGKASIKTTKAIGTAAKKNVLHPIFGSKRDFRWEELQSIEKRRRKLLLLVEKPFWNILMHFDGTVLSHLKSDLLLWLTMALYVGVRVGARLELPNFVAGLGSGNTTAVGGFLTFFLVFFVNQSHSRFFGLYKESMGCKGRIFDAATLARTTLPPERAHRLIRYMNASHAAGYVGLSTVYPARSYFDHIAAEFQFLTKDERQRMDEINLDAGGAAYRELIVWAMIEVNQAHKDGLLDNELANQFRDHILQLRARMGQLYNAADLPIPFFYVHFICLLTFLYLPLFAISTGIQAGTGDEAYWATDAVSGLVVMLQSIFVIGLRILAQKVSDPFGDDLVDLSVMFYVQFTWTHSNRILQARGPPENRANAETEECLNRHRITIGGAWDHGTANGLGTPSQSMSAPINLPSAELSELGAPRDVSVASVSAAANEQDTNSTKGVTA